MSYPELGFVIGDVWEKHRQGHWICITTNGMVKTNRQLVMGRGVAAQAKARFPDVPRLLGELVRKFGNYPHLIHHHRLISFPVKREWHEPADIQLIKQSLDCLCDLITAYQPLRMHGPIYLPKPGCGNGGLPWETVRMAIRLSIQRQNAREAESPITIIDRLPTAKS